MGFFSALEQLWAYVELWGKRPIESYVRLETADSEFVLAAKDGSLVSVLAVEGRYELAGAGELADIVDKASESLKSVVDRPGVDIQWFFSWDPHRGKEVVDGAMRAVRSNATNLGLTMDDIFDEGVRHLSKFVVAESSCVVIWTGAGVLPKAEAERAAKRVQTVKWPKAGRAQFPYGGMTDLRARHDGVVSAVREMFNGVGVEARLLEVHEALNVIRGELYPLRRNDQWRPSLPGDPISPRMPESLDGDLSELLWPPLSKQLCIQNGETLGTEMVRIGDLVWQGVDITLAPQTPRPFQALINSMRESGTPFRMSILIGSAGLAGQSFRKMAASLLGWTSDDNKQIKNAIEAMTEKSRHTPIVRLQMSLATWAPAGQEGLLERRVSSLTQSVEQWGYCQCGTVAGDALDGVMSSALGLSRHSTAPAAPPPVDDAVRLLPWQRAASPYKWGSALFRTPDGKLWPFDPGGSAADYVFDIIFAPPGKGKSVLLQTLNRAVVLSVSGTRLPYIGMIDIGFSSKGLIDYLREVLPAHRRQEVAYVRMKMDADNAINPFDTQLGFRYPVKTTEMAYLRSLLVGLVTPAGQEAPYDGMADLIGLVIKEMYRWRADNESDAQPNKYLPNIDPVVDEAIRIHGIALPPKPLWWDVVDGLFDAGAIHAATLAQRYAVPILQDAITAARRPHVKDMLGKTKVGAGGSESVIDAFTRYINGAIEEFKVFAGATRFDIGEARICSLDLQEVAPQGGPAEERQSDIMYMLARHVLVHHWWLDKDMPAEAPPRYRAFHDQRVQDLRELPKRINYDELHRTPRTGAVRQQIFRDGREGRKWGVQVACASQMLDDFDAEMRKLATGIWILGAGLSADAVKEVSDAFGLDKGAEYVIQHRLRGPGPGGAPFLFVFAGRKAKYVQHLVNTQGPVEIWALSTKPVDVAVRTRLYGRLPPSAALKVLAAAFPKGSAEDEIDRRKAVRAERGITDADADGSVLDEVVEDLYRRAVTASRE